MSTRERLPFRPDEGVRLEQVDRKRFLLLRGFAYTDPDGEVHAVSPEAVGRTDLASVPSILWWLVASYGRHTRAALVHDQLVDEIERHDADWVFRAALGDTGIGWARRWLAWSAVSFETTFRTTGRPVDQVKTEALERLRAQKAAAGQGGTSRRRRKRAEVRAQRHGKLVSAAEFVLVGAHLGAAAWLATWSVLAAVAVALSWIAVWGEWRSLGWAGLGRLASFVAGVIFIVPFTALLLLPLALVYAVERAVWVVRQAAWLLRGRRVGAPAPPTPDFGSTEARDAGPLQRL